MLLGASLTKPVNNIVLIQRQPNRIFGVELMQRRRPKNRVVKLH